MGHDLLIRFSEGRSNLGKVKNRHLPWDKFVGRFENPTRTRETILAYGKLPLAEKQKLKTAEGFFFAAPCRDGSRKKTDVLDRDILTIDIDENALGLPEMLRDGTSGIAKFLFLAHTTRSHTKENPKIRVIIPLATQLPPEHHGALSRIVSQMISEDMRMIDPVSHRLAQMMFKPSCSKDSEYFLIHNDEDELGLPTEVLDPKTVLDEFRKRVGDPFDFANLPVNPDKEGDLRDTLQKAEDPTTKEGPVGVWCRAYSIEDVIDTHLSNFYVPADHSGSDLRYTAVGAQGNAGCVIYDDGKFLFSNHTSDPCAEQLVNAWDIARLCLFGDKDVDAREGTKIGQMPSAKAMLQFAMADDRFKSQQLDEKFDLDAMIGEDEDWDPDEDDDRDDDDDDDEDLEDEEHDDEAGESAPSEKSATARAVDDLINGSDDEERVAPPRKKAKKEKRPGNEWLKELETDKQGNIAPTLPSVVRIISNDSRTWAKLAFNELENEPVATSNIKTKNPYIPEIIVGAQNKESGELWTDLHDATLRGIMAEPSGHGRTGYGVDPAERTMRDAVMLVAQRRKFHPIRDFLESLEWDGVERMSTILPRYLGCPDTQYHRDVFEHTLLAAVARAYEPGHKFDNMLILEGKQGCRKSTFIEVLAMRKWFLELTGDLSDSKEMAEKTKGAWFVEMAELAAHRKAEADVIKSWLSRRDEKVRMAYAKKPSLIRRQFVPIGTTNESEYLKDPTGARRFWPVRVVVKVIDTEALEREMPQVYAEAAAKYREMRAAKPVGDLWLDLRDAESLRVHDQITKSATAVTPEEELAGKIEVWLHRPVPLTQIVDDEDGLENSDYDRLVRRTRVCTHHVFAEVMGESRGAMKNESMFISRALAMTPGLTRSGAKFSFPRGLGLQRAFTFERPDFAPEDYSRGYAFADGEAAPESDASEEDLDDLI